MDTPRTCNYLGGGWGAEVGWWRVPISINHGKNYIAMYNTTFQNIRRIINTIYI